MAKVTGFFTGVRGKVGTTIFQVIKGVQVMKTFAIPENPGSSGQVAQRGVFSDIIATFKTIAKNVIAIFWESTTSGNQTPWGNFISKNLISMGKVAFDITDAILAFGTLEPVSGVAGEYDTADGSLEVTWVADKFVNGADTDQVHFVVYDSDSGTIVSKDLDGIQRSEEEQSLQLTPGLTATDLELFVWLSQDLSTAEDIGLVSNSVNATCTAPV